jgi:Flp pilus assembly protein TadG
MTAFFTVLVTALFAVAGLVVDYGSALQTKREAIDGARHAALAGAAQTSFAALRSGQYRIDAQRASTAARRFLDEIGAVGTVDATPEAVTVRVTAQRDTAFLGLFGANRITVSGVGRAQALHGVTREDP